jgi:hypothetical protein
MLILDIAALERTPAEKFCNMFSFIFHIGYDTASEIYRQSVLDFNFARYRTICWFIDAESQFIEFWTRRVSW